MTHLIEKEYYDEYDNIVQIIKTVKKPRYNKAFKFLCSHFNDDKRPWITTSILREKLCMPEHSVAFQILESLRILNLLKKNLSTLGRMKIAYYSKINPEYWETALKEVEDGVGNTAKK